MAHKNSSNWSPYKERRKASKSKGVSSRLNGRHRLPVKIYDFNEADDRIYDVFRNHDFADYPHAKRHQLVRFYQLLMQQQKKENFTRLTKIKDVALKHFIDSLIIERYINLKFPILDMGTGPGFPGIPLQINNPQSDVILAEGVQKRVKFLKQARETLGLDRMKIFGRNIDGEFEYPVHCVITRAVEDMSNSMNNIRNSLQSHGLMVFMKGPNCQPEIERAQRKWDGIFTLIKDQHYQLPNTNLERRLVVFEKEPGDTCDH